MDLQTIREKNRKKLYQTRADLLGDLRLLVDNSALYNGICFLYPLTHLQDLTNEFNSLCRRESHGYRYSPQAIRICRVKDTSERSSNLEIREAN